MKKKIKINNNNEIVEIIKWINSYNLLEKIFLITLCIYIIFLLFGGVTILSVPIIFLIPFVVLSGCLTFSARTLIRAILFCIVTVIPILCTILNMVFDHNLSEYCEEFKTLYNDCINDYQNNIGIKNNYDVNENELIGLIILCIFQVTFMIIVALLWQKRYWKFLPKFALTTREEIKRMFTHYIYVISLIHSNVIIIGYWISINWFYRTRNTYMNYRNTLFTNQFFDIIPYSLILFIVKIIIIKKGVQKESRLKISVYYILNIALCVIIFLNTVPTCLIPSNYIGTDSIIKKCDFTNQIRWSPLYQLSFIMGMVSILILLLSIFNVYLCQRNFGKKLKVYLDYEVEPIEFEYKDDPLLDQDTDDENV
ncbi:uncharacterized protein OCT59_028287 [Rhizophagus irregularis]|uniref:Uncharacterized protein n=2 Tax=Rhizophagus irregularis TaxID=588596 RepID=A0A915YUN7_9GLOM|nr:hypothetical protein OCT59_028287 [Rhizophagus irregularis]GBC43494.1 hypothetical protein GLOIN_2v819825 [Rhizophagus irregularis DAOM 181602=DAOM 197198]CAB5340530.1 unnamed protein product [Rhizophagus irregularis]